jgi:hypothetical protein
MSSVQERRPCASHDGKGPCMERAGASVGGVTVSHCYKQRVIFR